MRSQDFLLVDVIIPFKDHVENLKRIEEWIRKSDLLGQFRIILVHDIMSNNECEIYLDKLKSKFGKSRFIVVQGKFGSPGAARNAGLGQVLAQWVAFWDSDDVPNPKKFLDMILHGKRSGAKICIGSYEINSVIGRREVKHRVASRPLNVAFSPGIWRVAFDSRLLHGIKFSKSLWGEDQRLLFEIEYLKHPIFYYKESVYTYYLGFNDQLTRSKQNSSYLGKEINYGLNIVADKLAAREILFYSLMITRMMGTFAKYGTLREIGPTLTTFIKLYIKSPKRLVVGLIPSLTLILTLIPMQTIGRRIRVLCTN
jgi:glycosyltransferase involved in cell wall biosynthesis